jgi:hypothetical protein
LGGRSGDIVGRRRECAAGLCLVLAVSGCGLLPDHAPPARVTPKARQLWVRDAKPVGQPLAIGGVAVGEVVENRNLFVVGIDPVTGNELWRTSASPGEVVPGVAVTPVRAGDRVAFFRRDPVGNLYARLVVADARTGDAVASTGSLLFGSPPEECPDSDDVCALSRTGYDKPYQTHRLKISTGRYVAEQTGLPPRARRIGTAGLVDFGQRDPEIIGLVRQGKLRWRTPLRDAFPAAGFSTDNGWNWQLYPNEKVYAGSVHGKRTGTYGKTDVVISLAAAATAGLSEENGAVLWSDAGSSVTCTGKTAPARCRSKGTLIISPKLERTFTGLDVTVEGFDVRTGRTTWSVPVGAAEGLVGAETAAPNAGATEIIVRTAAGPVLLDLNTGKQRTPATDEIFWCETHLDFEYREPYFGKGGVPTYQRAGNRAVTCNAVGDPANGSPTVAATTATGAHVGPYAVVATEAGFVGYSVA